MIETLASIKSAIDIVKGLVGLVDAGDAAGLKLQIANLTGELANAKIETANLLEENDDLKRQVRKLSSATPEVDVREGLYYRGDDGPFCTGCYDTGGRLVRLTKNSSFFSTFGEWHCPACESNYGEPVPLGRRKK